MASAATTPEEYINSLSKEQGQPIKKLRETILENLPKGFEEVMSYGMIGYVVPQSRYPQGYHSDPKTPLPFVCLAAQKNHITLYHMGVYAIPKVLSWFKSEYSKRSSTKLDMGKSCIRFKRPENIPYDLIGELMQKISVEEWIRIYEKNAPARSN